MVRKLIGVWIAVCTLYGTVCLGQDGVLEELYGRGVHAYFNQQTTEAFNTLNSAVRGGSRDPRVFYFRGLTLNRLGRLDEARDDFRKGAELEILGGEPYPVGRALERIQGSERVALEAQRQAARVAIHSAQLARDRARFEQVKRSEADVLRANGRAAPAVAPGMIVPDASNPFGPAATPPAVLPAATERVAPIPAPAAAPPTADPFDAPATPMPIPPRPLPAEAPLESAPAPTSPQPSPAAPRPAPATPPATTPAAPPAEDPFAAPPPAASAPTTPATPPAAAPTAPAPSPPAADDPFAAPPTPAPAPATP